MQQRNILFSTTRQWNPGDEFILFGLENLLAALGAAYNPIIYNRNPAIYHSLDARIINLKFHPKRLRLTILSSPEYYDNSFKKKFLHTAELIDLAIFAGTPEWASERLDVMCEYIDRYDIPVFYLGIGLGGPLRIADLSPLHQRVLARAKLITVRDQLAFDSLVSLQPHFLPCPALFSATSQYEKSISAVKRIGLTFSGGEGVKNNSINSQAFSFMAEFYQKLIRLYSKDFDFEFVCHYIDDLPECQKLFPDVPCKYSYDARQYLSIYHGYDLVIGPRVHGIGMSASMGIPGIAIAHDGRADVCKGFLAEILTPSMDEAFQIFRNRVHCAPQLNKEILSHKHANFQKYTQLLTPFFI